MPRGYPDWFGQSIWPKYGTPLPAAPVRFHNIGHLGLAKLVDITGQGILYYVIIDIKPTAVASQNDIEMVVDGNTLFSYVLEIDNITSFSRPSRQIFNIDIVEYVAPRIVFSLGFEVPFKTSVLITVSNIDFIGLGIVTTDTIGSYFQVV